MIKSTLECWLDMLIDARKTLVIPYDYEVVDLGVRSYTRPSIHCIDLFEDSKSIHLTAPTPDKISEMAETLGVEWYSTDDGTDEWPITRYFTYKGIKFFADFQREATNEVK